jgi:hypothetical protein
MSLGKTLDRWRSARQLSYARKQARSLRRIDANTAAPPLDDQRGYQLGWSHGWDAGYKAAVSDLQQGKAGP